MTRPTRLLLLICLVTLAIRVPGTYAQDPSSAATRGLFEGEEILDLTLAMDVKAVTRDKNDDRPDRPATLSYLDDAGNTTLLDVGVKTRGHFRLHSLNCRVPPLRLNFKKKQVKNTVFAGQDKIKLVTHCKNAYEPFVLQEYLAYKIYNQLTEKSFRVRLVRITYEDTQGKADPLTKYAFFIEHEDHLAGRNGGKIIEKLTFHQQQTNPELTTLTAVFQYMIGNTDWVCSQGHNIAFLYIDGTTRSIIVPFDFDFSGFINAPYATPNPALNLKSVQERRFMGVCRTEEEFAAVFAKFNRHKEAIYTLVRSLAPLEKKVADRSLAYFEAFYEAIKDPRTVQQAFLGTCLKP